MEPNKQIKRCPHCATEKYVSEFYKISHHYSGWCKKCMIELSRQRVIDGRDKLSHQKYAPKRAMKNKKPVTSSSTGYVPKKKEEPIVYLAREIFYNSKRRAISRGMEFTLCQSEIEQMMIDFSKTHYCQITKKKAPFKPSIDRINCSKGYTPDNIRIVWLIENLCKNSFTEEDVIRFCELKLQQKHT